MNPDKENSAPPGTMLLMLQLPMRRINGELFYEEQACTGLKCWAENFPYIIVACPLMPEELAVKDKVISWKPITSILHRERIRFVPLPWSYSIKSFFRNLTSTRRLIKGLVQEATYLQFAVGGFIGDWPSIGAYEAYKLSKSYVVHMDAISHKLMKQMQSQESSFLTQIKTRIHSFLACVWNNFLISKASLALCNGKSVLNYYLSINKKSFLTYDIHYSKDQHVSETILNQKKANTLSRKKLKICYVGRMISIKAPIQWLKAIYHAIQLGAQVEAVWYGDGSLRLEFMVELNRLNLNHIVTMAGNISNRQTIIEALSDSDFFVMTHLADESPRNLIESMMRGTPVLGYDSSYARGILKDDKAGKLCPIGDWKALGELIKHFDDHRELIPPMIDFAAKEGQKYSEEAAFEERSNLIKQFCSPKS